MGWVGLGGWTVKKEGGRGRGRGGGGEAPIFRSPV